MLCVKTIEIYSERSDYLVNFIKYRFGITHSRISKIAYVDLTLVKKSKIS
jgi:hypothetical protein